MDFLIFLFCYQMACFLRLLILLCLHSTVYHTLFNRGSLVTLMVKMRKQLTLSGYLPKLSVTYTQKAFTFNRDSEWDTLLFAVIWSETVIVFVFCFFVVVLFNRPHRWRQVEIFHFFFRKQNGSGLDYAQALKLKLISCF